MAHHAPLQALGPVDWESIPQDDLQTFLDGVFANAQTAAASIPAPPSPSTPSADASTGRARAKTESQVAIPEFQSMQSSLPAPDAQAHAEQLRKEWKEVKLNARDNPHDISVYKMSSKDSKGAWFARRGVHKGMSFQRWKRGLESEFPESIKITGGPGSGNIRGIGAEKRAERREGSGGGIAEVFQLSAQFPGPTAPRDFITLLLTSESSVSNTGSDPLRQYMIVSKPCNHPECPPRQGIIRGQYESVEIIRELPSRPKAKRSQSSVDILSDAAQQAPIPKMASAGDEAFNKSEPQATSIEWLMITRSDPGGSVPRFMIEKGTPPGIVGDAGKFMKWCSDYTAEKLPQSDGQGDKPADAPPRAGLHRRSSSEPATGTHADRSAQRADDPADEEQPTNSGGLYGMLSGALGAAGTVVATGIRRQFDTSPSQSSLSNIHTLPEEDEDPASVSDTDSTLSFTSAVEGSTADGNNAQNGSDGAAIGPQEKELRKLQERRRKLDEKTAKAHERMQQKREGDKGKDDATQAKLREKHDREVAKQEAKYRQQLRKLEEKHEQEERKAEARRRKATEREEKSSMAHELERVKAERDVALKQMELLSRQVGELQAQNTKLVAGLDKAESMARSDTGSSSGKGIGLNGEKAPPVAS